MIMAALCATRNNTDCSALRKHIQVLEGVQLWIYTLVGDSFCRLLPPLATVHTRYRSQITKVHHNTNGATYQAVKVVDFGTNER